MVLGAVHWELAFCSRRWAADAIGLKSVSELALFVLTLVDVHCQVLLMGSRMVIFMLGIALERASKALSQATCSSMLG